MKNPLQILTLKALPAVVLAVLAFAAAGAPAQSDEVLTLDIKPQKAGSALTKLARSSGVQIMLTERDGAKVEVDGLKGEYRFEEALAALLTDTGLEYEYAAENVVLVQEMDQAAEPEAEDEASTEDEDAEEKEEPIELATQVVTGSRIKGGDPSARVVSITAEEIAVRGVSDLEELFRTLPWAFPSITTQTNTTPGLGASDTDKWLGIFGLGVSTVNLRAMGSANTLVLVNGRRVAGAGGYIENFANLLNVPISAVERVDVQLDGGSAAYGADAVGGIVNFILKKGYRGVSATARREYSSSGADRDRLSLQSGYAWNSGNLSFNLSRNTTTAIVNAKTGWTSNDYTEQYGVEYDLRSYGRGQPGVTCYLSYPNDTFSYWYPGCDYSNRRRLYQLPADHSGVGATVDEFSRTIRPYDQVLPRNGSDSTNTSFTMNVEQYITDNLRVYADVLYSKLDSSQDLATVITAVVPASNAYNPFGAPMRVFYWPKAELEAGLMDPAVVYGETEQKNYSLGVIWSFRGHELELGLTRSESWHTSSRDYALDVRRRGDPSADRWYAALESSDPSQALNLFGDGSVQTEFFADLFTAEHGRSGITERTSVEPLLRGQLFQVWGGAVNYALGAEFRKDKFSHEIEFYRESDSVELLTNYEQRFGVRPVVEFSAYFAELAIPLVGEDNARPGLHSLLLNLQARNDRYESIGSTGQDNYDSEMVPRTAYVPNKGWTDFGGYKGIYSGDLNLVKHKRSATSPRIGLLYKPVESLSARASWSRSFRPPLHSNLFRRSRTSEIDYGRQLDYAHPSGMPVLVDGVIDLVTTVNSNLKPEHSDNYSLGLDWSPQFLPGFRWTADWSKIDYTNRIESARTVLFGDFEQRVDAYQHPDIAGRDADGNLTTLFWGPINIATKRSETVETELQYAFETRLGDFTSRLSYMRVLEDVWQVSQNTPPIERIGTSAGGSEYRLTGSVSWTRGNFAVDAFAYYTPSYTNSRIGRRCPKVRGRCTSVYDDLPDLAVESLTTVDLAVTYRFDNGLRVRGGGRNVFKATAPTIWNSRPYDPTRWDARGQVLYLELNWEM